jgi:4-hydroxy-2-oxoheptanedioate aldolase
MRTNKLRELLKAGRPTLGTRLMSCWPNVVEAAGHTRLFDYVEFAAEYAPYDLFALENFCRAVELFDMSAMIKVDQDTQAFVAQRAIGAGFQSVLFVDTRNAEDARHSVAAVRPDTPGSPGVNGASLRRHCYMAQSGTPDYVEALNGIVVALMIEKQSAVDQLDEILAVPGIDLIQWGPVDYSMSAGRPGQSRSPETKRVERQVIETCRKAGIPARAEIRNPDDARYYLDLGVIHFSLGTDLVILHNWWQSNGDQLRNLLSASMGKGQAAS